MKTKHTNTKSNNLAFLISAIPENPEKYSNATLTVSPRLRSEAEDIA